MAQITGLEAASWGDLTKDWWQFILIAFILASVGLGLSFISYLAFQSSIEAYRKWKSAKQSVPASIKKYLVKTLSELSHYKVVAVEKKPESFGVYLGGFNHTPTSEDLQVLAQWDLLVVDAFQENVIHVLSSGLYYKPPQVLARLDISLVVPQQCKGSAALEGAIAWVTKLLASSTASGSDCRFSGILISNWYDQLPSPMLIEFITFIHKLGFQTYLETSSPGFLRDPKLAELNEVAGLIIRNGTISSNGDERDAFQMQEMRPTIKAFVSQACLRPFVVCLWETLDDGVNPANAIVRRSYQWSKFYSALSPWIGSNSDLTSTSHGIDQKEPLGAFSWLKEPGVMEAHKKWRLNHTIANEYIPEMTDLAENILGALSIEVDLQPSEKSNQLSFADVDLEMPSATPQVLLDLPRNSSDVNLPGFSSRSLTPAESLLSIHAPNRRFSDGPYSYLNQSPGNPISASPGGSSNDFLGCFPLGVHASRKSFDEILQSQKKLKSLDLLDPIDNNVLKEIGGKLSQFCNQHGMVELSAWHAAIQELANQLCALADDSAPTDFIRVYKGLDSGLQYQNESRYWAVFAFEERTKLDIFMSRNVQDLSGTILHTFLSSRGCPRHESFEAEKGFWQWSTQSDSYLPPRLLNDISSLSPSELLRFLQTLQLSSVKGNGDLIDSIIFACERELLDSTDFIQMKDACSVGYLGNQKSPQDLIALRSKWHVDNNSQHPSEENALYVFNQINDAITIVLKERRLNTLQAITKALIEIMEAKKIDARVDIICLALFSVFRKHAFDEAYVEVTDRNTLFNDQSDQAAAFAELFATGARCESYFDMTPSCFGKLLSDRYRTCHHQPGREPPIWTDADPSTPSAYAAAKIDIGDFKAKGLSGTMRFTFLSVFAIPALLDILLLTSTGKGLYLSGNMSRTAQHSATLALMISLLISGMCGTWITCGGSYYLISMAFSAMNQFIATRIVGGVAFSLAAGLIGLIGLGIKDGIVAGLVFFLYLFALSTYLILLATLANFSYPGTTFQSGRPVILMILPVLFVSPITTIFVPGYDIYIYLSVLYVFIFLLALGTRHTASKWTTWHQNIEKISDKELKEWYIKTHKDGDDRAFDGMTDPAALKISRTAMIEEIRKVRSGFRHNCQDPTVKSLVDSYDATIFLLKWYSGYSGTPLPMPYSSTWNMQIKVALDTLKQMQTGLRLHNAFIHWRQAGDEVGCSLLYFIVALLDKWNSLLAGGRLLGLSAQNTRYRMPVGFALAYYLIGAVLLDLNAAKLHTMTAESQNMLIGDVSSIPDAVDAGVKARRHLYWSMLGRYSLFHVWSLAVASSLLWVFDSTEASTLLFIAYVGAYTGLLFYQYTKIFAGPRSLKPLLIATCVGLPSGQILRHFLPQFEYCDVVALAAATWTAAFLSLYYAGIRAKPVDTMDSEGRIWNKISQDRSFHEFTSPGRELLLSQDELRMTFENLDALNDDEKYEVDPMTHPGLEIKSILHHAVGIFEEIKGSSVDSIPNFALSAFPEVKALLDETITAFESGKIVVECVAMSMFSDEFKDLKAIGCDSSNLMRIIIGCETMDAMDQNSSISLFCQATAEILLHIAAETFQGVSHEDAILLESLLSSVSPSGLLEQTLVPQGLRNFLNFSNPSKADAENVATCFDDEILRHTAIGCNPNIDWEGLPTEIRELILDRCTGQVDALTTDQHSWVRANKLKGLPIATFLARRNFGAFVATEKKRYTLEFAKTAPVESSDKHEKSNIMNLFGKTQTRRLTADLITKQLKWPFSKVYHTIGHCLKLFAIAFVAEPELQRELNYTMKSTPKYMRSIVMFLITGIWSYANFLQGILMPIFLLHGRKNVETLWKQIRGTTVSLKRQRIMIDSTGGSSTAFVRVPDTASITGSHIINNGREGAEAIQESLLSNGICELRQYGGVLKQEPADSAKLERISIYSKDLLLLRREDYVKGVKANVYEYEYDLEKISKQNVMTTRRRYPISRRCVEGSNQFEQVLFNKQGLVQSGSYILDGNLVRFNCHYRQNSNFEDELLRAEFVLPHMFCMVSWAAPPAKRQDKLDTWIPHSQVIEATFVIGPDVYESQWSYDHKYHPTIYTTLNGEPVDTPALIEWDHLGVLKKPTNFAFRHDDHMIGFKSLRSHALPRWLGMNTHQNPVSTSKARSRLWQAWKNNSAYDGVIMRWLDERLLRREPMLRPYYRRRDHGNLRLAEEYLHENADAIMAVIDLDKSISGWAPLAFQIADLYAFGQGGSANARTRSAPDFKSDELHVLATDSGTWPNEGGGVSACRRDMVNNLKAAKWYMISESANDFGVPKHQTQENVQTLKVIPIWGLDFMTPTHGIFRDRLDSEVIHAVRDATKLDIQKNFVPILKALVKGARTSQYSNSDILQSTRALVNLNAYFSQGKHWTGVWNSRIVKNAWRNLWISQDLVSPTPSEGWFQTEIPTIAQLDAALDLWFRYLFIFSLPMPERIPAIFQASHHSVSASYGIVCKITRGSTLQIWDHAISWRETNLYLSSDLCSLPPFVRNSLLGLMKLTSQLTLHHADIILPCADFFNPGWEIEIGSHQGKLEHRNIFKRKIDPVVNGIPPADISKFSPIKETTSPLPTVTMLSHVWYAKDIKTAILAADIIVNVWGFKDYRLDIYGAIDKAPQYSTDCFEILASKSLPGYVNLCGTASPTDVLKKTWVFLNSSISEGLPLALGEAALTGAPVVCTDVGASLRVLTDFNTGDCFSAVVAPNDAQSLARAQINMLGLLDEWAPYANDPQGYKPPSIIDKPSAEEVAIITKRMYEKKGELRALGMRSREIVQKSFGGNRYLREHEQMLWIGKSRYDIKFPSKQPRPTLRPALPSLAVASNMWGQASIPSAIQTRPMRPSIFRGSSPSIMARSMQAASTVVPSPTLERPTSIMGYGSGVKGYQNINDYFAGYRPGDSNASTPDLQFLTPPGIHTPGGNSVRSQSPMRKGASTRLTMLSRGSTSYDTRSESSSLIVPSKRLPGEDSFLRDLDTALGRV
ncbi:hypothetical protein BCIN_01g05710 [Botrytis cinerea B05.10]|uniref:Glycosyltransferase family 4 protein n=2 Tax=Botryotinia fuckeliana TaxID=40559 RepID=A0A384J5H2_BOTFB|nr:hypothetical protein BCIN_01g05710 [Botrytis cinerea B05.10]ATZ45868.1 hypothetical protein BCIN_01g05710 [Botrytis cinerea B05.10]CCD45528.1 glycosyltransferase family 4 protein [Botrytis cinerea T4]